MDKYFYSIEEDDGNKVIHLSANIYFNDSGCTDKDYRVAEWTWFYLTIKEAEELLSNGDFYDYINERIDYLGDLTKEEAEESGATYFNGRGGTELHIANVTEATPCGDYWFNL